MKILVSLILIFSLSHSFGQIVYDKSVNTQYIRLYKKLPPHLQKEFDQTNKNGPEESGLAIFTEFKCDTLNKTDKKQSRHTEVDLIDLKTGKAVKTSPAKDRYPILFCQATLRNDTLAIQINGLFLDQAIMHFVSRKQVSAFYYEHNKNDSILKGKVNDSLTTALEVPVKISSFVLSDSIYKTGDTVYGSGEILTNPYFKKDGWQDDHFYQLRWRFKYYFKCRIVKDESRQ